MSEVEKKPAEAVVEPTVKKVEETKPEETKTEEAAPAAEEEQKHTAEEVIKQVEFYFSDTNLPKDKFLWRTVQSNEQGWVSINTIAGFNRMKKFRPISFIVDSLKKSELLEVSENGEMLKRKTPILEPKESDKTLRFQKSVYLKGFPEETESTQEEIEKWISQYGPVNEVRLRRDDNKKFKSSVFIEFANLEDAQKFLEITPKPKYNDAELLIMSKPAYVEMKAQNSNFGGDKQNSHKRKKFNGFKNQKRQRRD